MADLAPPRERVLGAVRALVKNPTDPLAARLLDAVATTLDEHDAAGQAGTLAGAAAWLAEHGWTDAARMLREVYAPSKEDDRD